MSKNSTGSLKFFIAGMGLGGTLAMLFAPMSGKESQEWIAAQTSEQMNRLRDKSGEVKQQVRGWVETGKDRAAGAVQAGMDAYREATADPLERRS